MIESFCWDVFNVVNIQTKTPLNDNLFISNRLETKSLTLTVILSLDK